VRSVTLNNNWVIQLTGAGQRRARQIVRDAARLGEFDVADLRIGYTENGESFYWLLDDDLPALVLNQRVLEYHEDATRMLVALHELLHYRKVREVGWSGAKLLAGDICFEREIETTAFAILHRHYMSLNESVPEETEKIHELFLRNLANS
jgi:hypothetical protein